jgi:HEAT repeat protein
LDALDNCPELGKNFLEFIVGSAAEDDVREKAMDLHVKRKIADDSEWYRKVYEKELGGASVDKKAKKKKKKKKGDEPEEVIYRLPSLANKAFQAMLGELSDKDLVEALEGDHNTIKLAALDEYAKRDLKKAQKFAEDLYKHPETQIDLRSRAARILSDGSAKKLSKRFIEDAGKFATPEGLRVVLAEIIAELNDESVNKKLIRGVSKGKAYEIRFTLGALINAEDDKLNGKARDLLKHEDASVRFAAAQFLVKRGDVESIGPLGALLVTLKDPVAIAHFIDLMSELSGDNADWDGRLVEFAGSSDVEVRNAALYQIGKDKRAQHFDLLIEALGDKDWSTRLAALSGLKGLREVRVVGPIIKQMQEEVGRVKSEFGDALFTLTGQPFRRAEKNWLGWWEKNSDRFGIISWADLEEIKAKEKIRRLKQVTNSKFFGIRIVSHRAIFIIDVSGSMEEKMRTKFEGETSLTRMAIARRELINSIKGMERGALFNILIFSSEVDFWLEDGIAGANRAEREEAEAFVSRLKPGGGTNLYGSIEMAFQDPDVDTIFILSDGEPSVGEVTDIYRIREEVAQWNEHRKIEINTIGIGSKLKILEWLAEDSGGQHVKLR